METSDGFIKEILDKGPSPGTIYLVLSRMKEEGKRQRVIEECLKALDRFPDDINTRRLLGETYFENDQLAEAESELKEVIANIEDSISCYRFQAKLLIKQKREDEAVKSLKLYLAHRPEDQEAISLLESLQPPEEILDEPAPSMVEEAVPPEEPEEDAYEVPVMDGSAGPFAQIILDAGISQQAATRHFFVLNEPIELKNNGKFVGAYPDSTFRITCNIDFDHPVIRKQTCSIEVLEHQFACEISKARTFGFLQEVEKLIRDGLARGGSLDNAVVLDKKDIINTDGLRYEDEFVRHKLLDCIGDFSLLGMPVLAHIMTHKSGHAFNHAFLEKFFEQKQSWDIQSLPDADHIPPNRSKSLAI